MPNPANLLPELERIVREAGSMAMAAQSGTTREIKKDGSIVTPADRKVEEFLRQELPKLRDGCGINGEEMGVAPEGPEGLWCLDPIDGTSNYAFGSPLWGVSAGLVKGDTAIAGAVFIPVLNEMYLAAVGSGATLNGRPIPNVPPGRVKDEELVSCPDRLFRMYANARLPGKLRHTGAFIVDAMFACSQRYRGLVGLREKLHDIAASLCIAGEVGADVRYADGSALQLEPLKHASAKLDKAWIIFPAGSDFRLV
jgi:fructose-1,6-bisphosphatase/inositol monophosphatase family enzyme